MPGQVIDRSIYQGSTYLGEHFDNPLTFDAAYTMPTPTMEAINPPTVPAGTFTNTLFMGTADGYWIYKLYYNGNLVKTVQMRDQQFAIPMMYDRVESVSLGCDDDNGGHGHPHVPGPASSALILVAAAFAYGRKRIA
jgi:hypothetical protein